MRRSSMSLNLIGIFHCHCLIFSRPTVWLRLATKFALNSNAKGFVLSKHLNYKRQLIFDSLSLFPINMAETHHDIYRNNIRNEIYSVTFSSSSLISIIESHFYSKKKRFIALNSNLCMIPIGELAIIISSPFCRITENYTLIFQLSWDS